MKPLMPRVYRWLLVLSGLWFLSQGLWALRLGSFAPSLVWHTWAVVAAGWLWWQALSPEVEWRRMTGALLVLAVSVYRVAAWVDAGLMGTHPWGLVVSAGMAWVTIGAYTALLAAFGWIREPPDVSPSR